MTTTGQEAWCTSWRLTAPLRALKRHLARVVFRLLSQPLTQVSSVGA